MKSILMILASKEFRDIEYIVPRAMWEQKGITVKTASIEKKSIGRFGYEVENDFLIQEASADDFDAIFFVGGIGILELQDNQTAKDLAFEFAIQNKTVSAICAAPRVLLHWGILTDRKCTGHNWDNTMPALAKKHEAEWIDTTVVMDDNFVTGYGPEAAEETALTILENL
mgnify:CR=1 FL=1